MLMRYRRLGKGLIRVTSAVTILLIAQLIVGCGDVEPLTPAGPMIQRVTTNGFSVRWLPAAAAGGYNLNVQTPDGEVTKYAAPLQGIFHEVTVTNLSLGMEVKYWLEPQITSGIATGRVWTTRTERPAGEPFSFIVLGDTGRGLPPQFKLAATMDHYDVDFVLHVGDLIYGPKTQEEYIADFYQPYRKMLATTAFYPALGNHDTDTDDGAFFVQQFNLPTNSPERVEQEHCYWFDYGDARIACIDSNLSEPLLYRKVRPWLRTVFKDSGARWRFVYLHHPPYTGEVYLPDVRIQRTLVPEMQKRGVDMVFSGHAHLYERSLPLLDGKPHPDGIIYITTGAGGSGRREGYVRPRPYTAVQYAVDESFAVVTVADEMLHLKQVNSDNVVIDNITITKRRDIDTPRP